MDVDCHPCASKQARIVKFACREQGLGRAVEIHCALVRGTPLPLSTGLLIALGPSGFLERVGTWFVEFGRIRFQVGGPLRSG